MKPWPEIRFAPSLNQMFGKKGTSRKKNIFLPFYFVYPKTNKGCPEANCIKIAQKVKT